MCSRPRQAEACLRPAAFPAPVFLTRPVFGSFPGNDPARLPAPPSFPEGQEENEAGGLPGPGKPLCPLSTKGSLPEKAFFYFSSFLRLEYRLWDTPGCIVKG